MIKNYPYLTDEEFLKEIDELIIKTQQIKITVLTLNEEPIQTIQGKVTDGTLNLNGNSSMRRTCNLSLAINKLDDILLNTADNNEIIDLLSLNKKVDLEIGIKNITQKYRQYKIIWFPLGIFAIFSPSFSLSTSGLKISLQLKDKMCFLNGEYGGELPAAVTFSEIEKVDTDGNYIIEQPLIYQIIQELVNHFGGEPLDRIIINDIPNKIKKVMKWNGSTPLYYCISYDKVQELFTTDYNEAKQFVELGGTYKIYENGEDVGYILEDFVYPGELIGEAGQNICQILDKIKNALGNFEYFYDIYGNFVFQEIKNYINTSYSQTLINELTTQDYLMDFNKSKAVYNFNNSPLIISYTKTPQSNMIRNDFIIWGTRENISGSKVPIRYHLAIDKKPVPGKTYKVIFYNDPEGELRKAKIPLEFPSAKDFPKNGTVNYFYLDTSSNIIYKWDSEIKKYIETEETVKNITTKDWRNELQFSGIKSESLGTTDDYYAELNNEWPKLYNIENAEGGFRQEVINDPSSIDYFLDFIDTSSEISKLNISNIGKRTKTITDDSINCIFEPNIPDLILINIEDENASKIRDECDLKGQKWINVSSSLYSSFAVGGTKNSAFNLIKTLLSQYTSYNDSMTIIAMPIFHLEPNTYINIQNTDLNINDNFLITSITLPLGIEGTMTILGTKVAGKEEVV